MVKRMVVKADDDHSYEWARVELDEENNRLEIQTNGGNYVIRIGAGRAIKEALERMFPNVSQGLHSRQA